MKTYKTKFKVHAPATKINPPKLIKEIEVDVYDEYGEQFLTQGSLEEIEKIKKEYLDK